MITYLLNNIFFVFSAMLELSFGLILINAVRHNDDSLSYTKGFISFWGLFCAWTPDIININLPLNYTYHLLLMPKWQLLIIAILSFLVVYSITNELVILLAKLLTHNSKN